MVTFNSSIGSRYIENGCRKDISTPQEKHQNNCMMTDAPDKNESNDVLKNALAPVFEKYGLEYNQHDVFLIIGKEETQSAPDELSLNRAMLNNVKQCLEIIFEKHYDRNTNELNLENAIEDGKTCYLLLLAGEKAENIKNNTIHSSIKSVIITQYANDNNGVPADFDKLSDEEKKSCVKKFFEAKLKEYLKNPNTDRKQAETLLLKEFGSLIANTSDEDKHLLLSTAVDVFSSADAVKILFESFTNKEEANKAAESIGFEKLKNIDAAKSHEILSHMSKEGIINYLRKFDESFQKFYNEKGNIIEIVLDKIEKGIELEGEEISIKEELDKYTQLEAVMQTAVMVNANLTQNEKEDLTKQIDEVARKYSNYNLYINYLAEFVSENKNSLNISQEELTELLDKATDGRYSETVKNMPEKSAFDSDSSSFKTPSSRTISQSEEKIQAIKESIDNVPTPEQQEHETDEAKTDNVIDFKTLSENYNIDVIKDIFSGKIKISEFLQHAAVKRYRLMDIATQGNLLQSASGKFFNELLENTKASTLENLLSTGWKGRSFASTQKVKDTVEERKDDVA